MRAVGLKVLKNRLSEYVRLAASGETVLVTDRERIVAELAERRFKLLEALAEHLCALITGEFRAPWVRLSVAKLGHVRNVRKLGVTLERRRDPGE